MSATLELYNGDCLEIIDNLISRNVKIDTIITDPPYQITNCSWDVIIPFDKMWDKLHQITKPNSAILIFGNEPFSSALRLSNIKEYKYDWYWQKERPTNILQLKKRCGKVIENICVFYQKQCKYYPQKTFFGGKLRTNKIKDGSLGKLIDQQNKKAVAYRDDRTRYPLQLIQFNRDILTSNLHPTQKPVALLEYFLKTYTDEGDLVLDFTMGSGSTGVACKNLNRNFIGIELDKEYYNIATERISGER